MRPFHSIRWRVQGWYSLLFVLVLAALAFTAFQFERSRRLKAIDDELLRRASLVAEGIKGLITPGDGSGRRGSPGGPSRGGPRGRTRNYLIGETVDAANVTIGNHYYVEWLDRDSPAFRASANAPAEVPLPEAFGTSLRTRDEWREVGFSPLPDHSFVIGRSLHPELAELRRLGWVLGAAGATLLVLGFAGGWVITTRALRPIQDIGAAAERISGGDLAQRIDTRDTESELGQLAGVLNSTFSRLETAFAQQARFTADAAHELRTPVTVMLMHTQNALASHELGPAQRDAFEACERAAQRMRRLIDSLLKLARLDTGQETIPPGKVDLAKIVHDSIELVSPLAEASDLKLMDELAPAACVGNAGLLGQVVTNLLANAIQHRDKPGDIFATTLAENGRAIIVIRDDGPGIAAEHLPHLFERFYRVDKSRSSRSGGTGLGLAISRAIVHAHHGEISVTSELGRGTTFTVSLPSA